MRTYIFPQNAKFYKANLHAHTTLSDGKLTPAELKAAYKAHGYAVVAFTDHEALIDHADLCDESFIALNGYETCIKEEQVSTHGMLRVHHLNFIKKKPHDTVQFCFYPENFTPGKCREQIPFLTYTGTPCVYEYSTAFFRHLTDEAHKNGCLVHYNHPRWSLQGADDIAALDGIDGIEIFNTDCRYHGDYNDATYEALLRKGKRYHVVGGDDNHNLHGFDDSFGGFTMIAAERFTYEALTAALERGDAYASTGPEITEMYVEDGYLIVHTSPASDIILHTEGRRLLRKHGKDGYVNAAAFSLSGDDLGTFFRVEVIDKNGNRAYTRAYDIERYI